MENYKTMTTFFVTKIKKKEIEIMLQNNEKTAEVTYLSAGMKKELRAMHEAFLYKTNPQYLKIA